MCLLFETIKLKNGKFQHLDYHSARMNMARKSLLNAVDNLSLDELLSTPACCNSGIYKCKVSYDYYIQKIEFSGYEPKKINTLQLVFNDTISYPFKFTDRSQLDALKNSSSADDIIIVKNGKITDTSFSNIIFFNGAEWFTPADPLLKGTKRQALLDQGLIKELEITPEDLTKFEQAMLINAMLDMEDSTAIKIENSIGYPKL